MPIAIFQSTSINKIEEQVNQYIQKNALNEDDIKIIQSQSNDGSMTAPILTITIIHS